MVITVKWSSRVNLDSDLAKCTLKYAGLFARFMACFVLCMVSGWGHASGDSNNAGSAISKTSESRKALRNRFPTLFTHGMRAVYTVRDVIENDAKRMGNLYGACPDREQRSRVIVEYANILRPQIENDVLFDHLYKTYNSDNEQEELSYKMISLYILMARFCTDDIRLWSLAKDSVETSVSVRFSCSPTIARALAFMGMCRVPEAKSYFAKAVTKDYWIQLAKDPSEISGNRSEQELSFLRHGVVFALTNLNADDAIPILERLFQDLTPYDYIYEVTWRALDEMWRRKNGNPPLFIEYGTRYEYYDAEARPTEYPDWIYGIGGKKIEWPFGRPPEGYQPPRVHEDPF